VQQSANKTHRYPLYSFQKKRWKHGRYWQTAVQCVHSVPRWISIALINCSKKAILANRRHKLQYSLTCTEQICRDVFMIYSITKIERW